MIFSFHEFIFIFLFLFFFLELNEKKEHAEETTNNLKHQSVTTSISIKPEDCTYKRHPFVPLCKSKLDVCLLLFVISLT